MVFTDCANATGTCVASADVYSGNTTESISGLILDSGIYYIGATYSRSSGSCGNLHLTVDGECAPCVPPELHLDPADGFPQSYCVELCPTENGLISVGPGLSAGQQPRVTLLPGCGTETDCDNPTCSPVNAQLGEWTYADSGYWQAALSILSGSNAGCVCVTIDGILPVELLGFEAIAGDASITVSWTTASELDIDHFDIARDGTTISRVEGTNSPTGGRYSWTESDLINGREYTYILFSVDVNGTSQELSVASATPSMTKAKITEYALQQNYPNPFNPETSITFDIVEAGAVNLIVYNATGQTIATLANGTMQAGRHTVSFDGANLPSGLYFYRLDVADFSAVKKMVLMK